MKVFLEARGFSTWRGLSQGNSLFVSKIVFIGVEYIWY